MSNFKHIAEQPAKLVFLKFIVQNKKACMQDNLVTAGTKGKLAKGCDSINQVYQFTDFSKISGLHYSEVEIDVNAIKIRPVFYKNSGNRIGIVNL
jgi:hypothetical protein